MNRFIDLASHFYRSHVGGLIIRKIQKKYEIDDSQDFILILAKENPRINYLTVLMINKAIEKFEKRKTKLAILDSNYYGIRRRNEQFIILTNDPEVQVYAQFICRRINAVEHINDYDMSCLIDSFSMQPFGDRVILAAVDGIPGRSGSTNLGKLGLSQLDVIANGIFGLRIEDIGIHNLPKLNKKACKEEVFSYVKKYDPRFCDEY